MTMRPRRARSSPRSPPAQQRWTPSTFTSNVRHQSSGRPPSRSVGPDAGVRDEQVDVADLAERRARPPRGRETSSSNARAADLLARPRRPGRASARRRRPSQPSSASARAMFAPIPRPPPVTCDRPSQLLPRSRRVPPGSRATRGRRGRCRAPSPSAARRTIFAERVFGSASTKKTRSGLERLAELGRDVRARRLPRARRRLDPGSRQAKIHAVSPFTSCGTPIAAASRTAGWPTAADSSSAGPMRLPAMFSVSSERPCRNQKPSASTEAQSPCTHTPGMRDQYVSM